jgi:hypothetical protein
MMVYLRVRSPGSIRELSLDEFMLHSSQHIRRGRTISWRIPDQRSLLWPLCAQRPTAADSCKRADEPHEGASPGRSTHLAAAHERWRV